MVEGGGGRKCGAEWRRREPRPLPYIRQRGCPVLFRRGPVHSNSVESRFFEPPRETEVGSKKSAVRKIEGSKIRIPLYSRKP